MKISLELLVARYTNASTISCSSAALEAPVGKLYICPPASVNLTLVPGQFLEEEELTIPFGH